MATEKELKKAKQTFESICEILTKLGVKYKKDDNDTSLMFLMFGDDFPMHFTISVDAEREMINIHSPMPICFSEKNRVLGALATCKANTYTKFGHFRYMYENGSVFFNMHTSYMDSLISKEIILHMFGFAHSAVERFNDRFFMLEKGLLKLEDF